MEAEFPYASGYVLVSIAATLLPLLSSVVDVETLDPRRSTYGRLPCPEWRVTFNTLITTSGSSTFFQALR
jgi:hypothetical protein